MDDIGAAQERIRSFAALREWEQFHTPKNLAMALAAEAGELLEVFQWLTVDESRNLSAEGLADATEELADVAIYLLRLADVLGVPVLEAIAAKLAVNEERYPVEQARGNATKYSRRKP